MGFSSQPCVREELGEEVPAFPGGSWKEPVVYPNPFKHLYRGMRGKSRGIARKTRRELEMSGALEKENWH